MLIDKFLDDAIESMWMRSATAISCVIGGIMEHIERAGVHSGDSACSLPPKSIGPDVQEEIRRHTIALAKALNVRGLMNVQFAVQGRMSSSSKSIRGRPAPCPSSAKRSAYP